MRIFPTIKIAPLEKERERWVIYVTLKTQPADVEQKFLSFFSLVN